MLELIWAHYISDFICQSDEMAVNKSKSVYWLSLHTLSYTVGLFISLWLLFFISLGGVVPSLLFLLKYCLLNGVLHGMVDFRTSKWTSYLWKKEMRHEFFSVVGLDQALHMSILFITALMF